MKSKLEIVINKKDNKKISYKIIGEEENKYLLTGINYRIRIKNLREDKDLTQKDVAKVINKSQQGYSHIEEGRAELKIDDLIKLCKFYGVSADYMIGMTDDK